MRRIARAIRRLDHSGARCAPSCAAHDYGISRSAGRRPV